MEKFGIAFGRFQPFHKGHLEYIKLAKLNCDILIIGITNPDPIHIKVVDVDQNRSSKSSNPFTYFERMMMVKLALLENKLKPSEFEIVPFPINFPELLKYYIPAEAVVNVALLEEWGHTKIELLKSAGLEVNIVDLKKKFTTSTLIREKIRLKEPYEDLVPDAVWNYIKENRLEERIVNQSY